MSFYGKKRIAREVTNLYVIGSIVFSFVLTLIINPWHLYLPNFLILIIAWWSIRSPEIMSMGLALILGFFTDIIQDRIMGFSMMQYLLISFIACNAKNRIQNYTFFQQAFVITALFILATAVPSAFLYIFLLQTPRFIDYWSVIFSGVIWLPFVLVIVNKQYQPVHSEAEPHQSVL